MKNFTVHNYRRFRGDNYPFEIAVSTAGKVQDITGWSFSMTVDPAEDPADAVNNVFTLAGVVTDPKGGELEFRPTKAQMNFTGDFYYDIQATDAQANDHTIMAGKLTMKQDITK